MKSLLFVLLLCTALTAAAGERVITLKRDFGSLYGTLLTPETPTSTVALIIAGSGPTDRNGNNPAGLRSDCYRLLAEALQKSGIASLRYDKRAIGTSRLDDPSAVGALTLDHYIADAAALAELLASEGYRHIVLIGHSEGGLIALCAAQQTNSASAVVSLCGAGYPLDEILQLQLAAQLIPDNIELMMQATGAIATLKRGERVATQQLHPGLKALFNDAVQPFLISCFHFDPRKEITKLSIPVLVVGGDNDLQITPDNVDQLAKAQPKAQKAIVARMTHPLKLSDDRTLPGQMTTAYANPTLPIAADLTKTITGFINDL